MQQKLLMSLPGMLGYELVLMAPQKDKLLGGRT